LEGYGKTLQLLRGDYRYFTDSEGSQAVPARPSGRVRLYERKALGSVQFCGETAAPSNYYYLLIEDIRIEFEEYIY
jgi:hypothetical protein